MSDNEEKNVSPSQENEEISVYYSTTLTTTEQQSLTPLPTDAHLVPIVEEDRESFWKTIK